MAIITISIEDNINKEFREEVWRKLGRGKGVLARALKEAIKRWIEEERQNQIAERQIKLAKEGLYSLKGWKFKREDAYDR